MNIYDPIPLLQLLVTARGPSGQEDEMRVVCTELMRPICDDFWQDAAGNLVGKIAGKNPNLPAIRIMVHMDEIGMIVKRVNEDGSLMVNNLGALFPFNCGQGVVEIMGDRARILGILSFGCMHVTNESPHIKKFMSKGHSGKNETIDWEDTFIVTRKKPEQLKALGVHPGTRVVIAQSRRDLQFIEDCIAGYFIDNRAGIATALVAINHLKEYKEKPTRDIYLVATVSEEIGANGACYASQNLPGEISLSIDTGPVAKEYQTELSSSPIVVYKDGLTVFDKQICDQLIDIGYDIGIEPQQAVFGSYASDASTAKRQGMAAKAALLCIPSENTHGFEIIHQDAINKCAELLYTYLKI